MRTDLVIPQVWFKRIEVTTYITKGGPFFSGSPLIRTTHLGVLVVGKSYDE